MACNYLAIVVREWGHFIKMDVWTWLHKIRIDRFHKSNNFDILRHSIFPFPLLPMKREIVRKLLAPEFKGVIVSLYVALFFAVGTVVEIYGLSWVSDHISILNTINLIMLTFLVGVVVGRSWGKEVFEKMQWHLKSRTLPDKDVLNGAVMAVASILLITPGIVTDTLGLLILIPVFRGVFKDIALSLVKKRISMGEPYFFFKN